MDITSTLRNPLLIDPNFAPVTPTGNMTSTDLQDHVAEVDSRIGMGIGMKNKIINGNFDVWQRGFSSSSGGYLADRWQLWQGTSGVVQSQQLFSLGQTEVPNNPKYFHRTVVTSVAGANNGALLHQLIENVSTLAGKTATLSFYAKADSNKSIAIEYEQVFGTGGSPSTTVSTNITKISLTSSWKKFTLTFSFPSILGKTLGNNNDSANIGFWFDSGSSFNSRSNSLGQQSGTFDIAQVQLEEGSVPTQFENRHIHTELSLCQRYYEKSYDITAPPGVPTGNGAFMQYTNTTSYLRYTVGFKQTKRVIPTCTIYSNTGAINKINIQSTDYTAGIVAQSTTALTVRGSDGTSVSGDTYFQWTSDAEL